MREAQRRAVANPERERLLDELGLQFGLSALEQFLEPNSKADRTGAQEVTTSAPRALGPREAA